MPSSCSPSAPPSSRTTMRPLPRWPRQKSHRDVAQLTVATELVELEIQPHLRRLKKTGSFNENNKMIEPSIKEETKDR